MFNNSNNSKLSNELIEKLSSNFITNSSKFEYDLNLKNIDKKHNLIIDQAYRQKSYINQSNFRNWSEQSDIGTPSQFSLQTSLLNGIIRPLFYKLFKRNTDIFLKQALLDDISILELIDANQILNDNPVHLTPGVDTFYKLKNSSVNYRWMRYIYLTKRIISMNMLPIGGTWIDIGSYYGGLQGIVKKYNPKSKLILVDFHHQLCRSYIYLSLLYPKANHILPDQANSIGSFRNLPDGSIVYLPTRDFQIFEDESVDLATNFYSFGEMKKNEFEKYFKSKIISTAKKLYLVNRFVSAPFFDQTYDSNLSIIDYINNNRKIEYFDIFPMMHYFLLKRLLFNRVGYRNPSSSYFEYLSTN